MMEGKGKIDVVLLPTYLLSTHPLGKMVGSVRIGIHAVSMPKFTHVCMYMQKIRDDAEDS